MQLATASSSLNAEAAPLISQVSDQGEGAVWLANFPGLGTRRSQAERRVLCLSRKSLPNNSGLRVRLTEQVS
jgi:hypothetical protein